MANFTVNEILALPLRRESPTEDQKPLTINLIVKNAPLFMTNQHWPRTVIHMNCVSWHLCFGLDSGGSQLSNCLLFGIHGVHIFELRSLRWQ